MDGIKVNSEYVKKVANYVLVNAVVGDTLGISLNRYLPEEREKFLDTKVRKSFDYGYPKNRTHPEFTGKPSANTEYLITLLKLLKTNDPFKTDPIEFVKQLSSVKKQMIRDLNEVAYGIAVGIGTGLFFAKKYADRTVISPDERYKFVKLLLDVLELEEEIELSIHLLSFLIYNLCVNGYYNKSYLTQFLTELDIDTESVFAQTLLATQNIDYSSNSLKNSYYFQHIVLEVMHCMYCISTASNGYHKPRFTLSSIVKKNNIGLQDYLCIFGALCTASEHFYLLFLSNLQKDIENYSEISTFFTK